MGLRPTPSASATADAAVEAAREAARSSAAFDLLVAPVIALALVGVLALLLRWAFGHGSSLVARTPREGAPQDYGLLVVASEPSTFAEAEQQQRRLLQAGLRATTAPTTDGPRVLVFPADADAARDLLR